MKYLVEVIGFIFIFSLYFIVNIFKVIWYFEINPVIEEGVKGGYRYKKWDIKLWDDFLGIKRKPY